MNKILLIYTGGTIGMITNPETGTLSPFDFDQITSEVPELKKVNCEIETLSFERPIDSSDVHPEVWVQLADIIQEQYEKYDGFVVLHGSDTMAFSASALSFMLENLSKPVVFTGSQLPIGVIRTDGKENLVTAIEIAAAKKDGKPIVPEVCVYFEYQLYRGNRTTKVNAAHFEAFESFNYPKLAEAGINIYYNNNYIQAPSTQKLMVNKKYSTNVAVLKLFPGITEHFVKHLFADHSLEAVIIETFGSGNATTASWFLKIIKEAIERGVVIVNVTQCKAGKVDQSKYSTGEGLLRIGVVGGQDITFEAAVTKLMFLLGKYDDREEIKRIFQRSVAGEITE